MTRQELRRIVVALRKEGLTYTEIRNKVEKNIPKGTLSYWCSGIEMTSSKVQRVKDLMKISNQKAREKAWSNHREKRAALISEIRKSYNRLASIVNNKDVAKIALAMLYLGEGAKWQGHRGLMLGSSDPMILLIYIKLLGICFQIKLDQLRFRVSYRADQDIEDLEKYWTNILGVRKDQFYKTKADPRTIGKKTAKQNYKGVCVASCAGTNIQIELHEIATILASSKGL